MPLDSVGFLTGVVADLVAGRDYIKRNGWCQKQSRDGMRVCAYGGIFAVIGGHACIGGGADADRRDGACRALQGALNAKLQSSDKLVPPWNDEAGRTISDVLDLYDLAIERELSHLR